MTIEGYCHAGLRNPGGDLAIATNYCIYLRLTEARGVHTRAQFDENRLGRHQAIAETAGSMLLEPIARPFEVRFQKWIIGHHVARIAMR